MEACHNLKNDFSLSSLTEPYLIPIVPIKALLSLAFLDVFQTRLTTICFNNGDKAT